MKSNGASIVTATILLLVLASPGMPPSQLAQSYNLGTASVVAPRASSKVQRESLFRPSTLDPKTSGATDYERQVDDVLRQYCSDGSVLATEASCFLKPDNFVIALIPDPVHTHLALSFDRITDTIQEALQDDGYVFDRAVLPWDNETHPEPDDYKLRLEAKHYKEGREQFPGVLIFRPSAEVKLPRNPLVVLLVAENPTGGIQKDQFENAVRKIAGKEKRSEVKLRILGPTFSGSLSSLERLLTCKASSCYKSSTILSGTVSSRDAVEVFEDTVKNFRKYETGPEKTTFDTFQETDNVMLDRFVEFVSGMSYGMRDYEVDKIAILSEDETKYGSLLKSTKPNESAGMLNLYFPREISQLRAAYQDTSASANNDKGLPLQTLPHNFGVTGADDDTVASFSQKQTPLSQEAVLLSLVAELRKHAIEFVVLRATDPLDLLFLSHYLRAAYPQGRIVTINADSLFPREVEDTSLHGILALSTYSVSPSANHQFLQLDQSGAERMFPSSSEIGIYNALHALITATISPPPPDCQPSSLNNTCTDQIWSDPNKFLYLIQYGWRERNEFSDYNAPPVRVTALGHDGYWPIANLGPYKTEKTITLLPHVVMNPPRFSLPGLVPQFVADPAPVQVPNSWVVIEVLGLALASGFCVSLWLGSVTSPWQQFAQFAPTLPQVRVWLIAASGAFLILGLMIILRPFAPGSGDWRMTSAPISRLSLTVGISAVFLATLLDISQRSALFDVATLRKRPISITLGNLAAITSFVTICMFFTYSAFLHPERHAERLAGIRHFETLRAIQLTSGLSPILPILFLLGAGLWWANHIASGWILIDERRPCLPSDLPVSLSSISENSPAVKSLLAQLRPGMSSKTHYCELGGVLLGALYLVGTFRPLRTLEAVRYDRYQLLPFLILAWAGLIGTTLRLSRIWFSTRQLLLALDSSPLRRGFQRLQGFSWKPIWKFGGGGALDEYRRILAREREALQSAVNHCPELTNAKVRIDSRLQKTRDAYEEITKPRDRPLAAAARRKIEQKVIQWFGLSQRAVAGAARDALTYLVEECWPQNKEEPKRHRLAESADELKMQACERFVSLVYVSFLLVVLARMRTLMVAIGGMYILILLALTLYPFEPKPSTQAFLAASLVFMVVVVGTVFAQIHRDTTLSHITDTKPGELGGDFWLRMVSFIALPLFSLFASQFPEIGRFFYSWLQPALQALSR
jgi:hypothetical protein